MGTIGGFGIFRLLACPRKILGQLLQRPNIRNEFSGKHLVPLETPSLHPSCKVQALCVCSAEPRSRFTTNGMPCGKIGMSKWPRRTWRWLSQTCSPLRGVGCLSPCRRGNGRPGKREQLRGASQTEGCPLFPPSVLHGGPSERKLSLHPSAHRQFGCQAALIMGPSHDFSLPRWERVRSKSIRQPRNHMCLRRKGKWFLQGPHLPI